MDQLWLDMVRVALIGIGATAAMDVWLSLMKRLNVPTLNFALLGRWIGHLSHGQWRHAAIARAAPIKGELALGWFAHYAIGVAYAGLLVGIFGAEWMDEPSLLPAVAFGIATVVAPLFVMQPAMGAGIASLKTATPARNCLRSFINHAVFGTGLYLVAVAIERIGA